MALIDATARFAARREAARQNDGKFGEQEHSAPELSLDDIFTEMNELGELDDDLTAAQVSLDAPTRDTYTGTPEERETTARRLELSDLLRRAGIDRDDIPEKSLAEIQDGLARDAANRRTQEEYQARQAALAVDTDEPSALDRETDPDVKNAITLLIDARGYDVKDYHDESLGYMLNWARAEQAKGTLGESAAAEIHRSRAEREQADRENRDAQEAHLGPLTDAVWDDALEEDRARAEQTIRRLRPTKHVSLKDTNTLIRQDLKTAFGKTKFSVRGDSYAGGSSTHVSYVDGPPLQDAEPVAKAYSGATFDGMTDSKDYIRSAEHDADGIPQSVSYGPDFIFVNREFSDETTRDAEAFLVQAYAAEGIDFDPKHRDTPREIPQAFYQRASEENGFRTSAGSFNFGRGYGGGQHYGNELVAMAATMLANERWAAANR
jgi:hypothetical protein